MSHIETLGHVANVREPGEIDEALLDLLAEAYHDEPSEKSPHRRRRPTTLVT